MERLKKSLLYTYGIGDMFFVLMINVELYYFTMFLTDRAEFSMRTVQVILYITGVFDILCVLLAGFILERVSLKFGGKYRSWFLIGPLPIAILFAFQFTKLGSDITAAAVIITAFAASHLLINIVTGSGGAMVGRMSKQMEEITLLSTSRVQGMSAGVVIFSVIGLPLITLFSIYTNPVTGVTVTAVALGVLMIMGYLYIYNMTSGHDPYDDAKTTQATQKTSFSIMEIVFLVFDNRPLLMLIVAEIFRNSSLMLIATLAIYYCTYVIDNVSFMVPFLLTFAIFGLVGSVVATWIGPRLGKRRTYWTMMTVAGIIYILAYVMARFIGADEWGFAITFGLGNMFAAVATSMTTAFFSDTVVYGEWKNGKNIRGFTMAMFNLPVKISLLLRSAIVTSGLIAIGFVANAAPTPKVAGGILYLITFSAAAVCLLAAAIFFFGYKLKDEDVAKMQAEIAGR